MEESVTYQEIKDEGRVEGELEGVRRMILLQGRAKFGDPPPEAGATLEGIQDLNHLEQMALRVLSADSWQTLLAQP